MPASSGETSDPSLQNLAGFFLRLGCLAFGGPAVHIAMMQDELVVRRKWIASEDFLDLLAVSNLLPGPSSTELAIFIGYRLAGFRGLLIAGVCFILPAFLMVWGLAAAYVRYGYLPAVSGILYALKPVVLAIVIQAVWRLGRSAIKSRTSIFLGLIALGACIAGVNPALVLIGSGLLSIGLHWTSQRLTPSKRLPINRMLAIPPPPMVGSIFLVFAKFGCVVFGSGYVLLSFLRADLVMHRHWLTETQLLDAIAIGQITPGPVFTTATFIGYLTGGNKGAIAATSGIFAPAFFFTALTGPLIYRLRQWDWTVHLLQGFNLAAVTLMIAVTWQLARAALIDWLAITLLLMSLVILLRFKINPIWLILFAGVVGIGRELI